MNPLSPKEIPFFGRGGYLIKEGVFHFELRAGVRKHKWDGVLRVA